VGYEPECSCSIDVFVCRKCLRVAQQVLHARHKEMTAQLVLDMGMEVAVTVAREGHETGDEDG